MYLLVDGQVSGVISDIAQPIHISSLDQGHEHQHIHHASLTVGMYIHRAFITGVTRSIGDKTDSLHQTTLHAP